MENETQARAKLEEAIERNVGSAANVLTQVMQQIPTDSIVRAQALGFSPIAIRPNVMEMTADDSKWTIHRHALRQIADNASVPTAYVDHLGEGQDWQRSMLADVLTRTFSHSEKRHLVRAVNGQVRGFLSDRYRRLDSRPIFDAFVDSSRALSAQPYSGTASDVRCALKMVLPRVLTIPAGTVGGPRALSEYVALGVEISNSDFGAGKLSVRSFILRLACINGATAEDMMSQVHLGGRLNDSIEFSTKTYELDTRTSVSAVRDVVRGALGEGKVNQLVQRIGAAQEKEVEWGNLKGRLAKALTKEELRKAGEAFDGPDVQNLPPGKTLWRASNALSWIQQTAESAERKMELERLAGSLIDNKVEVAA
jgi:hypothetical protein